MDDCTLIFVNLFEAQIYLVTCKGDWLEPEKWQLGLIVQKPVFMKSFKRKRIGSLSNLSIACYIKS